MVESDCAGLVSRVNNARGSRDCAAIVKDIQRLLETKSSILVANSMVGRLLD